MIANRMLVTTCPDCETTFKLTVALLEKAGGQVRCGRCATVFDANSSLREQDEAPTVRIEPGERPPDDDSELTIETGTGSRWIFRDRPPPEPAATPDETDAPALVSSAVTPAVDNGDGSEAEADSDDAFGAESDIAGASGVEDIETDADAGTSDETESESLSATEPESDRDTAADSGTESGPDAESANAAEAADEGEGEDAATDDDSDDAGGVADWLPEPETSPPRRAGLWAGGAAVLLLLLGVQIVHAMRHEIAAMPQLGPALINVYASLGIVLRPSVDLSQYDTVDLTAVAEPSTAENGWLIIETRLQNKGPKVQAFPHIFVGLLDRWQETIAGRYFGPDEYMVTPVSDYSRMNVGSIVDAQFIIVDPGPSATGFVLEFCAPIAGGFACETE